MDDDPTKTVQPLRQACDGFEARASEREVSTAGSDRPHDWQGEAAGS